MCDSCWIRHGGMNPSGNTFLGRSLNPRPDLWIYSFQPHSSKLSATASLISWSHLWLVLMLNNVPLCLASWFFAGSCLHSLKPRQQISFFFQETDCCHFLSCHQGNKAQAMLSRCGHFFWVTLVRFKCARNSRVDDVSCPWGWLDDRGHGLWMHHISSTSSPLIPYFMRAPSLGQVWVLCVPR